MKSWEVTKVITIHPLSRYRGRPTEAAVRGPQPQEKVEQPDAGGCTHASEEMVGGHQHMVTKGPNHCFTCFSSLTTNCKDVTFLLVIFKRIAYVCRLVDHWFQLILGCYKNQQAETWILIFLNFWNIGKPSLFWSKLLLHDNVLKSLGSCKSLLFWCI